MGKEKEGKKDGRKETTEGLARVCSESAALETVLEAGHIPNVHLLC